jgi:type I restriction enzyme R subunit
LLHPARIKEISQYILQNFRIKTHRNQGSNKGFNAMFAVSSVDAAKCYYEELNNLQKDSDKPLKIATIFSFAANEEQSAIGEIVDETLSLLQWTVSAKEFLTKPSMTITPCSKPVMALTAMSFRIITVTLPNV